VRKITDFRSRLLSKVDMRGPDDCWPWTAGTAGKGYGHLSKMIGEKKKTVYAHREMLTLFKGPPPTDEAQALHSCDNVICCNPSHLSWGTESKNRREARDRLNNQGRQKLTLVQVEGIRDDPRIYQKIADDYRVHRDTVARIKQGRSWQP